MVPFIFLAAPFENAGVWNLKRFSVVFSSNTILRPNITSFEWNLAQILKTTELEQRVVQGPDRYKLINKNAFDSGQKLRLRRGLLVKMYLKQLVLGEGTD